MKKITLCSILCLATFLCNSQVVIFEQSPNNVGFSLASNFSENDEVGIYGADDFELTSDTALGQITFYGTIGNGTDPSVLTGFNVYIYENEGGLPSGDPTILDSGVVELVNISPDNYTMNVNGADISFAINITDANGGNQIVLPAGTYWIVGAANLEEELASPNRWSWMNSYRLDYD